MKRLWIGLAAAALCAVPALASSVIGLTIEDQARLAKHVVLGTVVSQVGVDDPENGIETEVTITVKRDLKGIAAKGDTFQYRSERRDAVVRFAGSYRPTSPLYQATPGTLEHFLTERYCLYAQAPDGTLYRAEVHHVPWPLQKAEAEFVVNEVASPHGLTLDGPPALLHFARKIGLRYRFQRRWRAMTDGGGHPIERPESPRNREPHQQCEQRNHGEQWQDRAQRHAGGELASGADRLRHLNHLIAGDGAEHAPVAAAGGNRRKAELRMLGQLALRLR